MGGLGFQELFPEVARLRDPAHLYHDSVVAANKREHASDAAAKRIEAATRRMLPQTILER